MGPLTPKSRNRRLSLRRPAKRSSKATCRKGMMGLGPNLAVFLLDLSEVGARMIVKGEMKQNEEVEINLMPPGGYRQVVRKGRIVWCIPTTDAQFAVGVKFDKPIQYATLQDIGQFAG